MHKCGQSPLMLQQQNVFPNVIFGWLPDSHPNMPPKAKIGTNLIDLIS